MNFLEIRTRSWGESRIFKVENDEEAKAAEAALENIIMGTATPFKIDGVSINLHPDDVTGVICIPSSLVAEKIAKIREENPDYEEKDFMVTKYLE